MAENSSPVIVIGTNHHNTLGLVRSLGEKKLEVYVILVSLHGEFRIKSKYIKKTIIIRSHDDIPSALLSNFSFEKKVPILYSSNDKSSLVLDNNKELLKDKFVVSSYILNGGNLSSLMNKYEMNLTAEKCGFLVPKTILLELKNIDISSQVSKLKFPLILKPVISALGKKNEIIRCDNIHELKREIYKLVKVYDSMILQEYIEKDTEQGIVGCSIYPNKCVVTGIISKIREFPIESGSLSFGKITKIKDVSLLNKINRFISSVSYVGLFDIEFLIKDDLIYFMEINYRNGGNGYAYTKSGVNLPYILYQYITKKTIASVSSINKERFFMMDTRDFRHVIKRDLSLFTWIRDFIKTSVFLVFSFSDIKPWLIYIFKRRRTNEKDKFRKDKKNRKKK